MVVMARATQAEMEARRKELVRLAHDNGPCSVRHVYYLAVVSAVPGITKDQSGYNKVQREVLKLRRERRIPYGLIVDNTRWCRQETVWNGPDDALRHTAQTYRRNLWADSPYRVEVWAESDSIAGTIGDPVNEWAVPLYVTRGQTSETFVHGAAEQWASEAAEPVVLYVGDHDPAGLEIEGSLREKLTRFSDKPFQFERIAVTWNQIEAGKLPGTQPKKAYGYPLAVEAEALPPKTLRQVVGDAIEQYVDQAQLRSLRAAEQSEREIFEQLARQVAV